MCVSAVTVVGGKRVSAPSYARLREVSNGGRESRKMIQKSIVAQAAGGPDPPQKALFGAKNYTKLHEITRFCNSIFR